MAAAPTAPPDSPIRADALRYFLAAVAVACGLSVVMYASIVTLPLPGARLWLILWFAAICAAAVLGLVLPQRWPDGGVLAMILAVLVAIGMAAGFSGSGLHSPAMAFLPLMACLAGLVSQPGLVRWVGLGCLLVPAALAWAEWQRWLPLPPPAQGLPLPLRLGLHWVAILTGLGGGRLVARMARLHVEALASREQRFASLLGVAADALFETDATLAVVQLSQRDSAYAGFRSLPVAPGQPLWQQAWLSFDDNARAQLVQHMQARAAVRNLPAQRHDSAGNARYLLVSAEPRQHSTLGFTGYGGLVRDVTDEVLSGHSLAQAELARHQSQRLLERVVETSPDVITLTDLATGRYEMVNQAFLRLFGWEQASQVVGRTALELGVWLSAADRQRLLDHVREHGPHQVLTMPMRMRNGHHIRMRLAADVFEYNGRDFLVINSRDVTDSERTLLEREAMLDNAMVGIVFTRDGVLARVNRRCEQMLGWPQGLLAGQPQSLLLLPPDDSSIDAALGQQVELQTTLTRHDGSRFPARLLGRALNAQQPADGCIWIVDDTTERHRNEAALAHARDMAEAANRAKSAFLANTSHEIRTPLNALVGLARLARASGLDDGRRRQYLEQIGDSAEALSAIISDILDLSKIEAGKLRLEAVPFDLHELLSVLHHAYAALADARGLRCTLELGLGVPRRVWGDPLRVRQVLANYLSNALKFTSAGGLRLVVHAAASQQPLRFEVHDTGCGIAADQHDRLFQPFSQLDDSSTRRVGGTGLGLSICRELATMMGGEVGVHSEPGQGSCFWASLPLPEATALGLPVLDARQDAEPLRGRRMLVVEDNPVNLMIGTALLQRWGAEVREATDGEQAVAAVQRAANEQRPFDLVLMDLQMPGMGGLQAAQLMRRQFGPQVLPIVALTAAALAGEREACLAVGMCGFVTKPIDDAQLLAALQQALAQRAG